MDVSERWRNDGKGYKKQYFYRAIRKYGWENINHIVLARDLTKEQAEQLEVELIAKYKSNNPCYGYNIDNGGKAGNRMSESTKEKLRVINTGKRHSEQSRQKMSESRKGKKLSATHRAHIGEGHKGKFLGVETKAKISIARRGMTISEETRAKLCEATKGERNPNAKKILLIDENGTVIKEFSTSQQAQLELHISKNSITAVLKGRQKQTKGYIFRYAENTP